MSREIKFRAWDCGQMLTEENFDFVVSDYNSIIQLNEYGWTDHGVDCVEQYTGLKDENGKEIYEGDIVTLEYDLENIEPEDCSVITFSNGCFRVGDGYENEAGSYLSDWQVIGNIHENPELLGGRDV